MSTLSQRNIEILKIIVEEYIKTGSVLGSKQLLQKYDLGVSPATVRGDMAKLELLELVYQPYNSAGRLPSSKGLRAFVNYLMDNKANYFIDEKINNFNLLEINNLSDFAYQISSTLAEKTGEIGFFVVPKQHISIYNGVGNFLEKNINKLGNSIFSIIKMLENKSCFEQFISSMPLSNEINIFIGEENIIKYLKDYSIIIKQVQIDDNIGYIGIIGSLQMNYSFNISAVKGII